MWDCYLLQEPCNSYSHCLPVQAKRQYQYSVYTECQKAQEIWLVIMILHQFSPVQFISLIPLYANALRQLQDTTSNHMAVGTGGSTGGTCFPSVCKKRNVLLSFRKCPFVSRKYLPSKCIAPPPNLRCFLRPCQTQQICIRNTNQQNNNSIRELAAA